MDRYDGINAKIATLQPLFEAKLNTVTPLMDYLKTKVNEYGDRNPDDKILILGSTGNNLYFPETDDAGTFTVEVDILFEREASNLTLPIEFGKGPKVSLVEAPAFKFGTADDDAYIWLKATKVDVEEKMWRDFFLNYDTEEDAYYMKNLVYRDAIPSRTEEIMGETILGEKELLILRMESEGGQPFRTFTTTLKSVQLENHGRTETFNYLCLFDKVAGIKIPWPSVAQEWVTRKRRWPPRELIEEAVAYGCHAIPKAANKRDPIIHSEPEDKPSSVLNFSKTRLSNTMWRFFNLLGRIWSAVRLVTSSSFHWVLGFFKPTGEHDLPRLDGTANNETDKPDATHQSSETSPRILFNRSAACVDDTPRGQESQMDDVNCVSVTAVNKEVYEEGTDHSANKISKSFEPNEHTSFAFESFDFGLGSALKQDMTDHLSMEQNPEFGPADSGQASYSGGAESLQEQDNELDSNPSDLAGSCLDSRCAELPSQSDEVTQTAVDDASPELDQGEPDDPERVRSWKLSYAWAEQKIARAFTPTQRYVYLMLKQIKREHLDQAKIDDNLILSSGLTTYHLKTAMFWVCEEVTPEEWEANPAGGLIAVLEFLVNAFTKGFLPNYFTPTVNGLDRVWRNAVYMFRDEEQVKKFRYEPVIKLLRDTIETLEEKLDPSLLQSRDQGHVDSTQGKLLGDGPFGSLMDFRKDVVERNREMEEMWKNVMETKPSKL